MCRILRIGVVLLALPVGCVPGVRRDRFEVRPGADKQWEVRRILVEQTSRPGRPEDIGGATVTLELADGSELNVEIDRDMRRPRAALRPRPGAPGSDVKVREVAAVGFFRAVPEGVRYETTGNERR